MIDDDLLVYFKLIKAGYASSLSEARAMTAREVVQAFNYESFCSEYEDEYLRLNK